MNVALWECLWIKLYSTFSETLLWAELEPHACLDPLSVTEHRRTYALSVHAAGEQSDENLAIPYVARKFNSISV